MYGPTPDPEHLPDVADPTWRSILAGYVVMAAVPLLLWAASQPLAGAAVLGAVAVAGAGTRRAVRLARCFYDCGGFSVDLGGRVRVAVTRADADIPC